MKFFYVFICLCISFQCIHAQSFREAYNSLLERYEYYNEQDVIIAYKKRDIITGEWVYTKISSEERSNSHKSRYAHLEPIETFDANSAYATLAAKEERYNRNVAQIQRKVDELSGNLQSISNEEIRSMALRRWNYRVKRFNKENPKLDYSSSSVTRSVINFFIEQYNDIIEQEREKAREASTSNKTRRYTSASSSDSNYWTTLGQSSPGTMRKEPSTNSSAVRKIQPNDEIYVIKKNFNSSKWSKIRVGNHIGFITTAWLSR